MIGVVLKKNTDYESFETLLIEQGFSYKKRFKRIFFVECALSDFTLNQHELIESCEESQPMVMEPQSIDVVATNITTDENTNFQTNVKAWGPHRIIRRKNPFSRELPAVETNFTMPYKCQRTGVGVDLYICDVGIDSTHQEFSGGRLIYVGGVNETAQPGDTVFASNDLADHGQMTSSCAGGNHNGVARDSQMYFVQASPFVALDEAGYLELLEIAYNHYMARIGTNRPAVANMSFASRGFGSPTPSAAVTAALDDVINDGLIVCIAANNDRWDLDTEFVFPAESHPDYVVVGSTDAHDLPMWVMRPTETRGTGIGSGVDIYAPGTNLVVASIASTTEYLTASGTSFASPYTAGVLACMLEGYQRLNSITQVRAVIQKLFDNSTKGALNFGNGYYGDSIINDRLLYLDPFVTIEPIDGLIPV